MSKVYWATGKTLTEQLQMCPADRWFSLAAAINEVEEAAKTPVLKFGK